MLVPVVLARRRLKRAGPLPWGRSSGGLGGAAGAATARAAARGARRAGAARAVGATAAAGGGGPNSAIFGQPGELFEVPPLSEDRQALLVWLHGLGDTGRGWSSTAPALHRMGLPFLRFLFPTAPLRDSLAGSGGRGPCPSWYEVETLDPDAIAQMPRSPVGLEEAAGYILDLVEPYVRRGLRPERVFLVGYSQGGGLALAAAARAPRRLGGVLMLSSWVAEPLEGKRPDCPVHIFHGAMDPVVPLSAARRCHAALQEVGARTTFRAYEGMTHGVVDQEVGDIAQTLYESLH